VKPGGLMLVATLNRTAKAFALAIVGAEHVLRWLPAGTHEWSKFVTPEEARAAIVGAGLDVEPPIGVSYSPLADRWSISSDTAVNYMLVATRRAAAEGIT
jgi:2-polyprenyl-6-hydroxyphenyl methylase/3-demethylubiquinone-9 3-methyltransferase